MTSTDARAAWTMPASADPMQFGRPDPDRPLFFVHIPRTGGFTLKHLLRDIYGARNTLIGVQHYDRKLIEPARYQVMEGHVAFRKGRRLAGGGNLMTIVREPVARTVSVARHVRKFGRNERARALQSGDRRPQEMFASFPELTNGQTKQLSNHRLTSSSEPGDVAFAKTVLDLIPFGLTERYTESMVLFGERFGLQFPRYGVTNASDKTGDDDLRSDAFRALATERNDLDQQLYDHARSVFQQRVDRYVDALRSASLEPAALSGQLKGGGQPAWDEVLVRRDATEVNFKGWLVVDGRAPDAVLAEAGADWVPLLARQFNTTAARTTQVPDNRYAGTSGTVPIGPDATTVTLEAYDRTAGVRARHELRIVRR